MRSSPACICEWVTYSIAPVHICRSPEKSQKAAEAVKSASGSDRVHALSADLSSLEAVRGLAADVKAAAPHGLDVVINNAGEHHLASSLLSHAFGPQPRDSCLQRALSQDMAHVALHRCLCRAPPEVCGWS
jgi:NAD(P)-dependent dehydrogenase (short-subunit alcohol dehydrogenase family)